MYRYDGVFIETISTSIHYLRIYIDIVQFSSIESVAAPQSDGIERVLDCGYIYIETQNLDI